MNGTPTRPKRSPLVVVLDTVQGAVAAVLTGVTPEPRVREAGDPGRRRRPGRILLALGALLALSGTALLVVLMIRQPDGDGLAPDKAAALPGARSSAAAPVAAAATSPATDTTPEPRRTTPKPPTAAAPNGGSATVPSSAAVPSSAPGGGATPLTARYTTTSYVAGLLGYRVTASIENPGAAARDSWLLTITLPRSTLRVTAVSGATAAQDEGVWTFTPDASTAPIPPGGDVQISFEVHGATLIDAAPSDCRIDGRTCAT